MSSIKEFVNLSEGEAIIREYHAIERPYIPIISRGVEGRIAVTNKRVIGHSEITVAGGKRIELNNVPLEKVEGTCLTSGFSTSWRALIGGIVAIIFGISVLGTDIWLIGLIALIGGIIAAIFAFRRGIEIGVRATGLIRGGGGLVSKAEPMSYLLLSEVGFRVFKIHGPDADAIMRGLDTVILEVKERGVEILKDLKCPNPECSYRRAIDEKPPKHCPECGTAWGK